MSPRKGNAARKRPGNGAKTPFFPAASTASKMTLPPGLTSAQYTFALAYVENGFNATGAYRTAHPNATYATARMEGSRTLAKPCVRAFLNPRLESTWQALQMGGEEALARVGRAASIDIRDLFDDQGKPLNPKDWPDSIAGCVKAFQKGPHGWKITLVDPLQALRTILEQTGKLKAPGDGVDALAAAIREDLARHGHAVQ